MILILTGTHSQPFTRLITAAEELAQGTEERVILQAGPCPVSAPSCELHGVVDPDTLQSWITSARVVITHAGPSSVFEAIAAGHTPLVVPRSAAHGEHVDDHQIHFLPHLGTRVIALSDPRQLAAAITRVPARGAPTAAPSPLASQLAPLIDATVSARRGRRRRWRATLAACLLGDLRR